MGQAKRRGTFEQRRAASKLVKHEKPVKITHQITTLLRALRVGKGVPQK